MHNTQSYVPLMNISRKRIISVILPVQYIQNISSSPFLSLRMFLACS